MVFKYVKGLHKMVYKSAQFYLNILQFSSFYTPVKQLRIT